MLIEFLEVKDKSALLRRMLVSRQDRAKAAEYMREHGVVFEDDTIVTSAVVSYIVS